MTQLEYYMETALELAEQGRWHACPNPVVGAVLVGNDGQIVGRGFHRAYGQPHAEVECLENARANGVDPNVCSLVVTLEPCNHHGKTPPCSQAIIEAGIKHVVIGMRDPNPQAAGGMEELAKHGVNVQCGILEERCRDANADFILRLQSKRPYVILKLASTLDGRIATRMGHSRWISGEESRAAVHRLRAGIGIAGGAVLVGGNTFTTDNPRLTARLDPMPQKQPLGCILASRLPRPDADFHILKERPEQCLFLTTPAAAASTSAAALRGMGANVLGVKVMSRGGLDLEEALIDIQRDFNCLHILCEGGGRLGLSLLQAGLVDEFHLHLTPRIIGDQMAKPLLDGRAPLTMDEALNMRFYKTALVGEDLHLHLRPKHKDNQQA